MTASQAALAFSLALAPAFVAGCSGTTLTSPTPTPDTAALLNTFSSQVPPGGSASRQFDVGTRGAVSITLSSTTPSGVVVGLGVGIPRSNGSCALNASVEAMAGAAAQITLVADTGVHCAKVYDLGTLRDPLAFTVFISRP